jgi:phage tail tape-measure protein
MSLGAIIALVIAAVAALLGGIAGNKLGRSTGRKEGAEQANQEQQITQAQATVKAVQERSDVDQKVASTPRADIDRELSEFDRPG